MQIRGVSRRLDASRRRILRVAVALALSISSMAANAGPLDGWASDNVQFVRNIPLTSSGGAYRVGNHLYVVAFNSIHAFDIEDEDQPREVGRLEVRGTFYPGMEDPDGTDEFFLVGMAPSSAPNEDDYFGMLVVIDIRSRDEPRVLAELPGAGDHTFTCVLACRWAYGGTTGIIIDLRRPARPRLTDAKWDAALRVNPTYPITSLTCPPSCEPHDVTEVSPGRVLTSTNPMYLLDATDPLRPRPIAKSDGSPYSRGGVAWPHQGRGRFILSFQEPQRRIGTPSCETRNMVRDSALGAGFKVWDASRWRRTGLFIGLDEYVAEDGTYEDGNPPANAVAPGYSCLPGWFAVAPTYRDQGTVALPYGANGTKFLDISATGHVTEIGYWLPPPTAAAMAAHWITDEIVYIIDQHRGLDVLRFEDGP